MDERNPSEGSALLNVRAAQRWEAARPCYSADSDSRQQTVTEIFSLTLNPIKSKVKDDFILTLNQFSVLLIKACEATFPNPLY